MKFSSNGKKYEPSLCHSLVSLWSAHIKYFQFFVFPKEKKGFFAIGLSRPILQLNTPCLSSNQIFADLISFR